MKENEPDPGIEYQLPGNEVTRYDSTKISDRVIAFEGIIR